jgi:hypothetical protein
MSNNEYLVEYAKSGRAKCKLPKCEESDSKVIPQGSLRIGKSHPSPFFDGMQTDWYHPKCLFKTFKNARKTSKLIEDASEDLKGFLLLKKEDKKVIEKLVENSNKNLVTRGFTKIKKPSAKKVEDNKSERAASENIEFHESSKNKNHMLEENAIEFTNNNNRIPENNTVTSKRYYLKGVSDKNIHVFHEITEESFLGRNSFNLDHLMNDKSISKEQVKVEPVCACMTRDNCTCESEECMLSICVMGKNPLQILKKGESSFVLLNKGETYRLSNGDQFNFVVGSVMFKLMTEVHQKNKRKLSDRSGPLSVLITDANKKQKISHSNSKKLANGDIRNNENKNNNDDDNILDYDLDDNMDVSSLPEIAPLHVIPEGESVTIDDKYVIKRYHLMYECSCIAFKMQSLPWSSRTCKHLKRYLGEEHEMRRVGGVTPPPPKRKKLVGNNNNEDEEEKEKPEKKTPKPVLPLLLAQKYENTDPTGWWMSEESELFGTASR